MSVHAWLLRLPAVLSESNGDLDAGATVTAADPLAETLIVRLDASHDYQPRRQVLANCAMVGQRWPVERTCLGPTQYRKLR
jgi:hypothetical protein